MNTSYAGTSKLPWILSNLLGKNVMLLLLAGTRGPIQLRLGVVYSRSSVSCCGGTCKVNWRMVMVSYSDL